MIGAEIAAQRTDDTRILEATLLGAPPPAARPTSAPPAGTTPRPYDPNEITRIGSAQRAAAADRADSAFLDAEGSRSSSRPRSPQPRLSLPSGFVVHNYKIQNPIGEGGFAITYRATDARINRQVALKELFLQRHCFRADHMAVEALGEEGDEKFFRWAKYFFSEEARITFEMRHENIVRIYEFFKTNGTAYIAYEMLAGQDLQHWSADRQHKFTHGEAIELFRACALALQHVHERGYIHRDIKPSNVFIDERSRKPILIDFGAATAIDAPRVGGEIVVSEGYSPIEQYAAETEQDARSDIYSLCATMYWALSGRTLPSAKSRSGADELVPLQRLVDPDFKLGDRLYRVLGRGLAVDRQARYESIQQLLDDLFPKVFLSSSGYSSTPRGEKVFLSYRREDSSHFSGRLLDFLEMRLGAGSVFFDVESIPAGMDFWDYIKATLQQCAVLVVIIGPEWVDLLKRRQRRWYQLKRPQDYVAAEIMAAIEMELPILPVLFDGASMPKERELAKPLRPIANLNAAIVGAGKAFRVGADGICDQITKIRSSFYAS
jgi:serine/threonine protein kinase